MSGVIPLYFAFAFFVGMVVVTYCAVIRQKDFEP